MVSTDTQNNNHRGNWTKICPTKNWQSSLKVGVKKKNDKIHVEAPSTHSTYFSENIKHHLKSSPRTSIDSKGSPFSCRSHASCASCWRIQVICLSHPPYKLIKWSQQIFKISLKESCHGMGWNYLGMYICSKPQIFTNQPATDLYTSLCPTSTVGE